MAAYSLMESVPRITLSEIVSGLPLLSCEFNALDDPNIDYNVTWLAGDDIMSTYSLGDKSGTVVVPAQLVTDQLTLKQEWGYTVTDQVHVTLICNE